ELREDLERRGVLRNPLVVDETTNVVLDGMHRRRALSDLGLEYAPVCRIDYADPVIEVGTWTKRFDPAAAAVVAEAPVEWHAVVEAGAPSNEVPERPVLVVEGTRYELDVTLDALEHYSATLERLEAAFRNRGFVPTLIPDTTAVGSETVYLRQPRPSKATVVRAATERIMLPANASRHVVPYRPVGVDVPLEFLDGPLNRANRRLVDHLEDRRPDSHTGPGLATDRAYDETVVDFS
ncbi:MAG: hypothetical protein ACOC0X_07505, partial [Halobacteriota archaeon]